MLTCTCQSYWQDATEPVVFRGTNAEATAADCVLVFDGTSFVLERVRSTVQSLRHVRVSSRATEHLKKR